MRKSCRVCNKDKKIEKFVKLSSSEDGHTNICKKCHREAQRRYRENNPDNYKSAKLKSKYGISLEQLNDMKEQQEHKCKICTEQLPLVVDHCHQSEQVRGLLCGGCNKALGFFLDKPMNLHNAIIYLVQNGRE